MKKLVLATVFAFGTVVAVNAQEKTTPETQETPKVEQQADEEAKMIAQAKGIAAFKEIKISELPDAVVTAVSKDFEGAEINQAFVNEQKQYKLVLSTQADGKKAKKTVYANAKGEWLKTKSQS
ncbi:hypothetical protein [Patiriisocius hiemis]|uniref:DUF4878 domain-containing protein n=1 Tax=Patiriisocius hiemis TaxID=3075604 RepID=A0ABU2YF69_9FLAO|nr:hypothetical protein [Constantimarinum sp. W242]MDT0556425.1 hypothetical protein [Constantimarinum sp. W242]